MAAWGHHPVSHGQAVPIRRAPDESLSVFVGRESARVPRRHDVVPHAVERIGVRELRAIDESEARVIVRLGTRRHATERRDAPAQDGITRCVRDGSPREAAPVPWRAGCRRVLPWGGVKNASPHSQTSPTPLLSMSSCPGLNTLGQLSMSAQRPSASQSSRGSTGHESQSSPTPSASASSCHGLG